MKFVLLGSLGNVTRPLAISLVEQKHSVFVVTSKNERAKEVSQLGAHPLVGDASDVSFLTESFKGADAVYLMLPLPGFTTPDLDIVREIALLGAGFRTALLQSGVKHAVLMTGLGSHSPYSPFTGTYHMLESMLTAMPPYGPKVTFVRPVFFYENIYRSLDEIKATGTMSHPAAADAETLFVSPQDIARTVEKHLKQHVQGEATHGYAEYICSDIMTNAEFVKVVGQAIGKEIKWNQVPADQMIESLVGVGFSLEIATQYVGMLGSKELSADFIKQGKPVKGTVKVKDFAETFAKSF